MKRVKVRGEATNIPDKLILDVTALTLGQTIKVRDLSYPDFNLLDPKNNVIASVKVVRATKGDALVAEAAPEAAAGAKE